MLAEAAGSSRRIVVKLEGGDTNISLSSLDRLAEALGISFVALVSDLAERSERLKVVAWRGTDEASKGTLLGRGPATREAELWYWSLGRGESYQAEGNLAGWH